MSETETGAAPSPSWIRLTDSKHFSRLLYTNPVCFLCTAAPDGGDATQPQQQQDDAKGSPPSTSTPPQSPQIKRNVMVVSWLTATNNTGMFVMSIHKTRHTVTMLMPSDDTSAPRTFVLCVPVRGMEGTVLDVGGCSGRWGNKFSRRSQSDPGSATPEAAAQAVDTLSNRQKKKLKRRRLQERGVDGLEMIAFNETDLHSNEGNPADHLGTDNLFAVKGTVARMLCKINGILHNNGSADQKSSTSGVIHSDQMIDDQHVLLSAQIVDAYVMSSYWNEDKSIFQPQQTGDGELAAPYLTFFGSQTFGHVHGG